MQNQLRQTETHSGDDSQGVVWGIQGKLLWLVIGAASASVCALLILFALGAPFLGAFCVSAVLMGGPIGYVIFRQTHPPGYDRDLFQYLIHGPSFGGPPWTSEEE